MTICCHKNVSIIISLEYIKKFMLASKVIDVIKHFFSGKLITLFIERLFEKRHLACNTLPNSEVEKYSIKKCTYQIFSHSIAHHEVRCNCSTCQ